MLRIMLLAKTLQLKTIFLKEFIYLKTGNFITEKDPVFTVNVLSVTVSAAVHMRPSKKFGKWAALV